MAGNYIFSFLLALIVSAVTQFLIIRLSHKRGIFIDDHESDQPQKFHDAPTPRIGGIGVFLACLLIMLHGKIGIFLIISPKIRLAIMLASGFLAIWLCDAVVTDFGFFSTPYAIGVLISFIAIVGLINGTNMIDGYNGLLGLTSVVIFSAYAIVCYQLGDTNLLTINVILVGGLVGSLVFNYPAGRIFMGDGGAYFIGFVMAVLGMMLAMRHQHELSPFFVLCCICYPVLEVIFSFTRKGLYEKISPMQPDKWHFHMLINRVLCNGVNKRTTLIIVPIVACVNIAAVVLKTNQLALAMVVVLFTAVYFSLYFYTRAKDQS
jgi:UDP-GlcNAc:undecaprenyl-phosphate/decaprenyl-phosphate GlcNAc-1-phosphate transferase